MSSSYFDSNLELNPCQVVFEVEGERVEISAYLDNKIGTETGGVVSERRCGRRAVLLQKRDEGKFFIKRVYCYRIDCPDCGGKGGRVHKRRARKMDRIMKYKSLRQLVFTVPEKYWDRFRSRKGLNALRRIIRRVVEKHFPGKGKIYYLHLRGDKDGRFKPHWNVHVLEGSEVYLKLSGGELREIKEQYKRGLEGFLRERVDVVDVNYSFVYATEVRKKRHRIKYMSDPSKNKIEGLDLEGFRFVRCEGVEEDECVSGYEFIGEIGWSYAVGMFGVMNMELIDDVEGVYEIRRYEREDIERIRDGWKKWY